jgi:hypothetical protein
VAKEDCTKSRAGKTFWSRRHAREEVDTLHDGVPAFLIHDVDPEGVVTLVGLAPCLLNQLDHLAKWFVGQSKGKLLQTPDDKLPGSKYLRVIGMDIEEVDRRDELKLRSSDDKQQWLDAKGP